MMGKSVLNAQDVIDLMRKYNIQIKKNDGQYIIIDNGNEVIGADAFENLVCYIRIKLRKTHYYCTTSNIANILDYISEYECDHKLKHINFIYTHNRIEDFNDG